MKVNFDDRELKFFIEDLNKIIEEAIRHGSDGQGAYYVNADKLIREMRYFMNWLGLGEQVGIMDDDGEDIRYYLKRHIVEDKEKEQGG